VLGFSISSRYIVNPAPRSEEHELMSGLDHVFHNFGFAPDSDVNHGEPS
jgi:hypothetical protein